MVQCAGDPCDGAMCPSHPLATCRANFCGSCTAEWYLNDEVVACNAGESVVVVVVVVVAVFVTTSSQYVAVVSTDAVATVCEKLVPNPTPQVIIECNSAPECSCPPQPHACPADSILREVRVDNCCVTYECVCPNISCPLIMESGQGVQPVPNYRGNQFPGRCCPDYSYEGK